MSNYGGKKDLSAKNYFEVDICRCSITVAKNKLRKVLQKKLEEIVKCSSAVKVKRAGKMQGWPLRYPDGIKEKSNLCMVQKRSSNLRMLTRQLRQVRYRFPLRSCLNITHPLDNVLIFLNVSGKLRGGEAICLESDTFCKNTWEDGKIAKRAGILLSYPQQGMWVNCEDVLKPFILRNSTSFVSLSSSLKEYLGCLKFVLRSCRIYESAFWDQSFKPSNLASCHWQQLLLRCIRRKEK